MKKLLLATSNPGKLSEMRFGLVNLSKKGWQLLSLADLKINHEPEETGQTFAENAELKARHYARLAKMPALADDGGFVIPYLNNQPGVRSARWLGKNSNDENLIEHTIKKLKKAKNNERAAYLELVLCFFDPQRKLSLYENEKISGFVASKPTKKRIKGFPYRALLKVCPFNKYYDELSPQEHAQANHRLKALSQLQQKLNNYYE
jgi:XTP/dITP diphosphohydrolase